MQIEIDQIGTAGNVRIDHNDVTALSESIERLGLLQPVVVKHDKADDGSDQWILIAGHRRLAACISLGWKTIEAVENHELVTSADRLSAQYAENVFRKDLSAYEKAQVALDLKAEGLNQGEVAKELGLSKKEVSRYQKAARTVSALPNAESAVALTEQALFELAEPETYYGTPIDVTDSLVLENALRLMVEGESRDVRSALGSAEREAKEARILEALEPRLKDIHDRGHKLSDFEEISNKRGSVQLVAYQEEAYLRHDLGFSLDEVETHRRETCHAYTMQTGGYSGTQLVEWCLTPRRHEKTGKSDLKTPSADAVADRKLSEKQERADKKAAKLDRVDDVQAVLEGFTIKKVQEADLVGELYMSSNQARIACRLLGLEAPKSEYGGYPLYSDAVQGWLSGLAKSQQMAAYQILVCGADYIDDYVSGKPNTKAFFVGKSAE
jgi:ParB/RepB/Spo0J family partition protein